MAKTTTNTTTAPNSSSNLKVAQQNDIPNLKVAQRNDTPNLKVAQRNDGNDENDVTANQIKPNMTVEEKALGLRLCIEARLKDGWTGDILER